MSNNIGITAHQRAKHVLSMRANFKIESMSHDADDAALQAGYIAGTTTLADMLAAAQAYASQFRSAVTRGMVAPNLGQGF